MRKIRKLFDKNSTHNLIDLTMSELLEHKFDLELKSKYQKILAEKHEIFREPITSKKNRNPYYLVGFLLLLTSLIVIGYFMQSKTETSYEQLAYNYSKEHPFSFNINVRSSNQNETKTLAALSAFESNEYEKAISLLSGLDNRTNEQLFLLGYTYLSNDEYESAITIFEQLIDRKDETSYISEARFYAILSYFRSNKTSKALENMNALDPLSWEHKELKTMLQ